MRDSYFLIETSSEPERLRSVVRATFSIFKCIKTSAFSFFSLLFAGAGSRIVGGDYLRVRETSVVDRNEILF